MKKTAVTTSILVLTGLLFAAPGAWADGYGHGRYDGYSQQHDRGVRDHGWDGARAAGALFGGIVLGMAAMQADHGYAHWGEHHREDRGAYYHDHHRNDRRFRHAWSYRSTMPQRDQQRFAYHRSEHRGYRHDYHYRDRQAYRSHDRYEYRRYGERGDDR